MRIVILAGRQFFTALNNISVAIDILAVDLDIILACGVLCSGKHDLLSIVGFGGVAILLIGHEIGGTDVTTVSPRDEMIVV